MANSADSHGLPTITFTLDTEPTLEEGFPVRQSHSITVHLDPEDVVSGKLMRTAAKDAELMAALFKDKGGELQEFCNHVVSGRRGEATEVARSIGLSEFDFKRQGGGMWPYILGIGVVLMGMAAFDLHPDGSHPPPDEAVDELPHGSTESS